MDFGEQLTMLVVLIVLLGVAYFLVTTWSKRAGSKAGDSAGTPVDLGLDDDKDDSAADLRQAMKDRDAVAKQREKRFQLTGKDAEVAAKVLKRMLKQDREEGRGG
jgi:hypothetical protein